MASSSIGSFGSMVYTKTGDGGTSASTASGRKYAIRQFNYFLNSKGLKQFSECNEETLCKLELLQEFATFLCFFCADNNRDLISQGTAVQYLSGVKMTLADRFKTNLVMQVGFICDFYW